MAKLRRAAISTVKLSSHPSAREPTDAMLIHRHRNARRTSGLLIFDRFPHLTEHHVPGTSPSPPFWAINPALDRSGLVPEM